MGANCQVLLLDQYVLLISIEWFFGLCHNPYDNTEYKRNSWEVKIATRNMFYDEQGKHRRTKKEILDEQGNLWAGCSIIPKGKVYESHIFTKKDEWFKNDAFTREIKEMFTEIINSHVKEESEKLSVFQQGGVYLATKKIGKNNPREAEIRADNAVRQEWNEMRTLMEKL